jgi:hypothetical protein
VRVEDLADVFDFVAENAAFRFAAGAKVEDLSIGIVVVVGLRERDGRRRPRLGGGWPMSWRRWDVELRDEGGDEDVLEDEWLLGLLEADGCFGKVERRAGLYLRFDDRLGGLVDGVLAHMRRRRQSFDAVGGCRRRGEGHLVVRLGCVELGSLAPQEGFSRAVLVDEVMALWMGPLGQ